MSACTRLLVSIPSLTGPCLEALKGAASGGGSSTGKLTARFEECGPHGVTACARLVVALCSCTGLREELLDHSDSLGGVTAALKTAASRYGSACEEGATATAASRQAGMLVDTMLGRLGAREH